MISIVRLTRAAGPQLEVKTDNGLRCPAGSGTLHYRGARIQIVDLPGIIEGAKDGKGRGRQVSGASLRTFPLMYCSANVPP